MSDDPREHAQPLTRSIPEIVNALEIVEYEFRFHARRIKDDVEKETEEERKYMKGLERDYSTGAIASRRLRMYLEKRMKREGITEFPEIHDRGIVNGRSTAFTGEEDGE